MSTEKTCKECRYFVMNGCRRFPPNAHNIVVLREAKVQLMGQKSPSMVPMEETRSMFPTVRPDWWCGEWVAKLEVVS